MHHKECTYLQYVVAMHVGTLNSTFNLTGFYTDLNRRSACLHTYVHTVQLKFNLTLACVYTQVARNISKDTRVLLSSARC